MSEWQSQDGYLAAKPASASHPDPAGGIYSIRRSPAAARTACDAMNDEYAQCHRVADHEGLCCFVDSISRDPS